MEWHSILRWIGTTNGRFVTGSVVAAIAVALGVVLLFDAETSEPRSTVVVASVPDPAPAPAPEPASSSATDLLAASPNEVEEVQICGGAWLKAEADGSVSAAEAEASRLAAVEAARAQTLAAMAASSDERSRAAARLYRFNLFNSHRIVEPCPQGVACTRQAENEQRASEAEPERTALVQLAQGSNDPQVYAWAYRACNNPAAGAESPCQLLSTEQWARLDPSNALPWFYAAAAAEKQGDADALDDAMFHVAHAERLETGWGSLTSLVVAHAPSGEAHSTETFDLAAEAIGVEAAGMMPYQSATSFCSVRNLGDANRRETCDGIASLLVERSSTLLERNIGLGMGRRLGWPQERIEALEQERDALLAVITRATASVDELSSCTEMRRGLDRFRDLGAYGEIGSARRAITMSRTPISVLAANYRHATAEQALHAQVAAASGAASAQN